MRPDLVSNPGPLALECVSDMGFTAHQHKKAISSRIRYKIICPICMKSKMGAQ